MKEQIIEYLANYQKDMKQKEKEILEKYNNSMFDVYELTDRTTGAVYMYDCDTVIFRKKEKNHPIFKIFDINCIEKGRKYTCNLNDKIILRGPDNYYFGFCYLTDLDVKNKEIIECLNKTNMFMKKAQQNLIGNKFSYNNILDFKLVLAILDILRNSVIINLFFMLMKENEIYDVYIYNDNKNKIEYKLYKLLENIENKLIDILLNQKYSLNYNVNKIIENFINIQNTLVDEIKHNKEKYKNDLYVRYRKCREADNAIENIICIKYALDKIDNMFESNKEIYALGINYGSIELAIILKILLEEKNRKIDIKAGNVLKKFRKVFINAVNKQSYIKNIDILSGTKYFLIDENIMTGNTLLKVEEYLKEYDLEKMHEIVIQYPTVARYKNIKNDTNEVEYIKMLRSIKGMLIPTKYSKMCEYRRNFDFPYMDKLGTFDLYKYEILKNLYKNGRFSKGTSVERIGKYYENIFI